MQSYVRISRSAIFLDWGLKRGEPFELLVELVENCVDQLGHRFI